MGTVAVTAIQNKVDRDYSMQFTPSFYLLRDLLRIIGEKHEEEPFGISFGDEAFIHLFDGATSRNETLTYSAYYAKHYPQAVFYFWNGHELEVMERRDFFSKLMKLAQ